MAVDNASVQELIRKIDSLTKAHESLVQALALSLPSAIASADRDRSAIPAHASSISPTSPTLRPIINARRNTPASLLDYDTFHKGSVYSGDDSSDSDGNESFCVQNGLPAESFTEEDLRHYLKNYDWEPSGQLVLGDLIEDKRLLPAGLFQDETEVDKTNAAHTTIYDVGPDGAARAYTQADSKDVPEALWRSLSNVNTDSPRRPAVGRIAILREPSSLLLGAAHLTMNKHFDMDEIFRLLTDETPAKAYMKGCLKPEPRQQRSFVFSFKYHCIVGKEREPMPWQKSDNDLRSTIDHIPISTCSSVVALSFTGNPITTLRKRSRRAKTIVGHVFDPFSPWRVLSIQCYPDWKSTVDVHDQNRQYVNGPEAFIVTLLAEYRDAQKRFMEINKRIVLLVTPPVSLGSENAQRRSFPAIVADPRI